MDRLSGHLEIMPCQTCCCSPTNLFTSMAMTSCMSSSKLSTANTCGVRLLRLAVITASTLLHLVGHSLHTSILPS